MNLGHAYRSPVMWRTHYDSLRNKWRMEFVLTNLFYLAVVTCLVLLLIHCEKKAGVLSSQKKDLEDFKKKEAIYSILRSKGISLNQGVDIANAIIGQSRTLDIPVSLILAVMKKESAFNPYAVSSRNALGLMQIHPVTWKEYADKLKLNSSPSAAFDPVTNVVVATHIIKELYDSYKKTALSESDLWESVLSAYYAGRTSLAQTGFQPSHRKYVADVNRYKREFEKTFSE
jgi:soluble lytic murein transglycosylase-like protein